MAHNPDVALTLEESVQEVLSLLTGLDIDYDPQYDRYRTIARTINRALRAIALEKEWSYFSSVESLGIAVAGERAINLRSNIRLRKIGDDAVRFVVPGSETIIEWAALLPRDALHKYEGRYAGMWASTTGNLLSFSKPIPPNLAGLEIQIPVMREPKMFEIPPAPKNSEEALPEFPEAIRNQKLDFDYPDVVILKAAYMYAQTDPIMQPRVQTIEAQYKDLTYALIERDDRSTDSVYLNDFFVPISNGIDGGGYGWNGRHPHSDERR